MFKTLFALVLGVVVSSSAFAVDKAYFEIKSVEVKNVTKQYAAHMDLFSQVGLNENCNATSSSPKHVFAGEADGGLSIDPLQTISVVIDQIINIGKKIWNIVEAGKPVVNIKFDTANALPKGVSCWTDLSGWNMPQSQVYKVSYVNGLGMNVVDFSYRITFTANGSVDGVGQYITNATFLPANVNVAWGYTLNAEAAVPSVFNQGTKTAPVAGMQMDMRWHVTSALFDSTQSESYFVSGDNKLVQLK